MIKIVFKNVPSIFDPTSGGGGGGNIVHIIHV